MSLGKQYSLLLARDSTDTVKNIYPSFNLLISAYAGFEDIRSQRDFNLHELHAELTLRDALFLSAFFKYYLESFYALPQGCFFSEPDTKGSACSSSWPADPAVLKTYDHLTKNWSEWPARYTKVKGRTFETVGDWHSYVDGVLTLEVIPKRGRDFEAEVTVVGMDGIYFDGRKHTDDVEHVILSDGGGGMLEIPSN